MLFYDTRSLTTCHSPAVITVAKGLIVRAARERDGFIAA